LSMPGGAVPPRASSFLLLTLTLLVALSQPDLIQSEKVAEMQVPQATTLVTTTTDNSTSTSVTSNQTTSAGTASSSWQWDLLIPFLVISIGASLAVIVAAVVAVNRRHRRAIPTVQLICPRCRAPISPYDTACRNCRTPIYHPYRYYGRRR
jgi:hypothetical protein